MRRKYEEPICPSGFDSKEYPFRQTFPRTLNRGSLVKRKSVFKVSDQILHKQGFIIWQQKMVKALKILFLKSRDLVLYTHAIWKRNTWTRTIFFMKYRWRQWISMCLSSKAIIWAYVNEKTFLILLNGANLAHHVLHGGIGKGVLDHVEFAFCHENPQLVIKSDSVHESKI